MSSEKYDMKMMLSLESKIAFLSPLRIEWGEPEISDSDDWVFTVTTIENGREYKSVDLEDALNQAIDFEDKTIDEIYEEIRKNES